MVLIIQEPRAHQPEGQEIVPFDDLVEFGDGEKNVAFLIKKTYEKKAPGDERRRAAAHARCWPSKMARGSAHATLGAPTPSNS